MSSELVVIGLGYVGLPLAQAAVRAGLSVVGLDVSSVVVDGLNNRKSHIDDLSDGDIEEMIEAGFRATLDDSVIAETATVVICVPTPLSEGDGPDLGAVLAASAAVSRYIRHRTLVILESTTYPGTTEEVVLPILEESGLIGGVDFHLAFSPERIDPGNQTFGMKNTPKVVGGLTPHCADMATAFYGQFVDTVVRAIGTREAEMSKLLENTYRHINIALVNEMVKFCHELEIDLWDVIRCASTKPFGFQAFHPGPGVGGHCIPIDPNYLSFNVKSKLGYPFRFVELAQEINASMPAYVVARAQELLNRDAKALRNSSILLLGVTYKRDIADQRESPAEPIARRLASAGAIVRFHDPLIAEWKVEGLDLSLVRVTDIDEALSASDLTVLLQDHSAYDLESMAQRARRFLDTRGSVRDPRAARL